MPNPSTGQQPWLVKPKHGRVVAVLSIQRGSLGHTVKISPQEPEISLPWTQWRCSWMDSVSPPVSRAYTQIIIHSLETFDPTDPTFSDFTQIIWQSTTELGCASAQCNGIFDTAFGEATVHVCLYEPVGNVVGGLLSVVKTHQPCLEFTTTFRDNLGIL